MRSGGASGSQGCDSLIGYGTVKLDGKDIQEWRDLLKVLAQISIVEVKDERRTVFVDLGPDKALRVGRILIESMQQHARLASFHFLVDGGRQCHHLVGLTGQCMQSRNQNKSRWPCGQGVLSLRR